MRRKVNKIIVHCSDSNSGCGSIIRTWHLQRGWAEIGYHFVILNGQLKPDFNVPFLDGQIEVGRDIDMPGAHSEGDNLYSVGICLIGRKEFSDEQKKSLLRLLRFLIDQYGLVTDDVFGHYETSSGKRQGKTCPNINMDSLREELKGYIQT